MPATADDLVYASIEDIDEAMRRHAELQAAIDEREAEHTLLVETDQEEMSLENSPRRQEQQRIERAMRSFLKPRRRRLIDKHGKVMELQHGTIAFRIIGKHLIGPKGNAKLVNFFLKRRGGKRYLVPKWEPNRELITHTHSRILIRQLAGLGYRIGRTERLTFKPKGYAEPIQLDEQPYNLPK